MIKTTLALCLAMASAGLGNLFLRRGMKGVGPLENYRIGPLLRFFGRAITNFNVVFGILISCCYFFLWLVVLSWTDVSWALPMNAIEFVFVALLATLFLKEKVNLSRWIGIGLITLGVFFMMQSWK